MSISQSKNINIYPTPTKNSNTLNRSNNNSIIGQYTQPTTIINRNNKSQSIIQTNPPDFRLTRNSKSFHTGYRDRVGSSRNQRSPLKSTSYNFYPNDNNYSLNQNLRSNSVSQRNYQSYTKTNQNPNPNLNLNQRASSLINKRNHNSIKQFKMNNQTEQNHVPHSLSNITTSNSFEQQSTLRSKQSNNNNDNDNDMPYFLNEDSDSPEAIRQNTTILGRRPDLSMAGLSRNKRVVSQKGQTQNYDSINRPADFRRKVATESNILHVSQSVKFGPDVKSAANDENNRKANHFKNRATFAGPVNHVSSNKRNLDFETCLNRFKQHATNILKDQNLLIAEYQKLKDNTVGGNEYYKRLKMDPEEGKERDFKISNKRCNINKNRYLDIGCFGETRVELKIDVARFKKGVPAELLATDLDALSAASPVLINNSNNNTSFFNSFNCFKTNSPQLTLTLKTRTAELQKTIYQNSLIQRERRDYINANWLPGIDSYGNFQKKCYIAAQGPLPHTAGHFIEMVFQNQVSSIVQLTRHIEGGKSKCFSYWPRKKDEKRIYEREDLCNYFENYSNKSEKQKFMAIMTKLGQTHSNLQGNESTTEKYKIIVEFKGNLKSVSKLYQINELKITKKSKNHKSSFYLSHAYFENWKDHSSPEASKSIIDFIKDVRSNDRLILEKNRRLGNFSVPDLTQQIKPFVPNNPIIIHCSAGIGRTGSYIAIDQCMHYFRRHKEQQIGDLKASLLLGKNFIYNQARELRNGRAYAIQNEVQYEYIYRTVLEFIQLWKGYES